MKATDVILRDHEVIQEMFEKFKAADTDGRVDMEPKLFNMLMAHELMEDTHLYPVMEEKLDDNSVLEELDAEQKKLHMEATAIRMAVGMRDKLLLDAIDKILAHAKKEEDELFPLVEDNLSADEQEEIGNKMAPDSAVEAGDESLIETVKNITE
jgi:hemerythrin superfamily protein